jgi:SAM-dependent MidA family methyltransferase
MEAGWRTWRTAMAEALYGDAGFYTASGAPGRHFRTAAHVSPLWAQAWAELAQRVDRALGEPDGFTVVDVGAGGGELIAALDSHAPSRWRLVGVDVAPAPSGLPERVDWLAEVPRVAAGLLLAVEWLDVVPLDVVELTDAGPRVVEVDAAGAERLGSPPTAADAAWVDRWWPPAETGDRTEVGVPRDEAWADAVDRLGAGVAVAVDYAVEPARDVAGTLTGYRDGRQVAPVPDASMDLTAHVLLASCAEAARVDTSSELTQREALRALGVRAERPAYGGDPSAYLHELSAIGDAAELLDPAGLGGFHWLVQAKGCVHPFADDD